MTRAELLARCEALHARAFSEPGDRETFDQMMGQIDRLDGRRSGVTDAPPIVERVETPGLYRGVAMPTGDRYPDSDPAPEEQATPVRRDLSGLVGRRRLIAEQLDELEAADLREGERILKVGFEFKSLAQIRRDLANLPTGMLDAIQARVNELEDLAYGRQQRAAEDADRQARLDRVRQAEAGDLPLDDIEQQQIDELLAEHKRIAAYENSTEGKLDKIATLLTRLVEKS